MILKVKHEELQKVKHTMIKDGNALNDEIKIMQDEMEKLKTIWQGQDASTFYDNVYGYLDKMKKIPASLIEMGNFINNMDRSYTERDQEFSKELQKEEDNYEQNINN